MTERTIFALLDAIRARPGMYVGDVDDHPAIELLRHVESHIAGYGAALHTHAIREPWLRYWELVDEFRSTIAR